MEREREGEERNHHRVEGQLDEKTRFWGEHNIKRMEKGEGGEQFPFLQPL